MKKTILYTLLLLVSSSAYSQFDDILKKVAKSTDIFKPAVSTSIKDAYTAALWLDKVDQNISLDQGTPFSLNLNPGYYKFKFNTFCLHAGTYEPTEGSGYLVAPLKGAKADLIKSILGRYYEHTEVPQQDVQMLVWGIEAGQKFTDYPADFQFRVTPLLQPEDIALMQVDIKEIGYDLLPNDVKELLSLYRDMRGKMSDINSTYEDIEKLAVKTGIAPPGKGSRNIDAGTWSSVGGGAYIRIFPFGYKKSDVEIYIPQSTTVDSDDQGKIKTIRYSNYQLDLGYEGTESFSTAVLKNTESGAETSITNSLSDYTQVNSAANEFVELVKKSFGKKKSGRLTKDDLQRLKELKRTELTLKTILEQQGVTNDKSYSLAYDAVNGFVAELETKASKKNGGENSLSGLGSLNGMVFAPANTSQQRLGSGGPEGGNNGNEGDPGKEKEKKCRVSVTMRQVEGNQLPEPDTKFNTAVYITIEGDESGCEAEEIMFTLFDVSKEPGRFINDIEKYDDRDEDLQISTDNSGYEITKLTAHKMLSGKTQSQSINIDCRDWGAYGKLKASVKVKGQWYDADGDGTPDKYITIPVDYNNNNIADAWEKQNDVYGKSADWDEDDIPTGITITGDGLTNYEEYRGVNIDGPDGSVHKRTNPRQREIFVLDKDEMFVGTSWEAASGIKSYYLNSSQVFESMAGGDLLLRNKVNFCSDTHKGNKYAVRIIKVNGLHDPDNEIPDNDLPLADTKFNGPPKNVQRIYIFVDRIKMWFEDLFVKALDKRIAEYPTGSTIGGKTFTKAELQYFRNAVNNPQKLQQIVEQEINTTTLHEVGHALALDHHAFGDNKCPMNYGSRFEEALDDRLFNILTAIDAGETNIIAVYSYLKFCKTNQKCFQKLNVNDNK